MKETLKYIKVLSLGFGGFDPMTLSTDFAKSLQQVQERLGLLDSLNYDALLDEAINGNGKEYLQKYQSTDDTIEYSLHFLRDRKDFLEMLQPDYLIEIDNSHKPPKPIWQRNPKRMFRWAFDAIDIYKADGVWTEEQWRECKWTLSEIEKGLGDRLRQFATAYDYSLDGDDPNQQATTEPQQGEQEQQRKPQNGKVVLPDVLNTQKTIAVFDEAITRGWMQPNGMGGYVWLGLKDWKRGKQQQLVYMIGQMYGYKKGDSGNDGNNIPSKALEKLFGIDGIYSLLIKCWQVNKPQPWREAIDDMIETALQGTVASTSN